MSNAQSATPNSPSDEDTSEQQVGYPDMQHCLDRLQQKRGFLHGSYKGNEVYEENDQVYLTGAGE